eukprot:3934635-Rhodomonas_salina.2
MLSMLSLRAVAAVACLFVAAGEIDVARYGRMQMLRQSGPPVPLLPTTLSQKMAVQEFNQDKLFSPADSVTFSVVEGEPPVNLHFLDNTNLRGFTGQDMVQLGP